MFLNFVKENFSLLGSIGYLRRYFGRCPQKSKELSIEISAFYRKHHKKSFSTFHCPEQIKDKVSRAFRPLFKSSNYNSKSKKIYFRKCFAESSAQLPLCPVVSICVEELFVFSTKVSTFLRRPPTMSLFSNKTFPFLHLDNFYKGKLSPAIAG